MKLTLRSAYNLICFRQGDEWKTTFSTTNGHYEHLVMPYGLSNSSSVSQVFINELFHDMLGKQVVVCIDDILIHSPTLEAPIPLDSWTSRNCKNSGALPISTTASSVTSAPWQLHLPPS